MSEQQPARPTGFDLLPVGESAPAHSDGHGAPPEPPSRRRRLRPSRPTVIGIGGVALALIAAGAVHAASSSAAGRYRLATVVRGDVTQATTAAGTLAPVSQASVTFPTSGTVAHVYVHAGQKVSAGHRLAQLDTTQMQAAVANADKSMADAQANLERVENGETSTGSQPRTATTSGAAPSPGGSGSGSATAATAKLNQAVARTQQQIMQALAGSTAHLAAASQACGGGGGAAPSKKPGKQPTGPGLGWATSSPPTPSPPTGSPRSGSPTPSPSPATTSGTTADTTACTRAQQQVQADQSKIAQLQQRQAQQMAQLAQATSAGAAGRSQSTGQSTTTSSTSTATSEQITAAQDQVYAAQAQLTEADQNLRAATIVSPIGGTVLDVPFAAGDQVSTDEPVVVSGSKQYQATVQISVDQIPAVRVGQPATVTPSGSDRALKAKVTAVAPAPTSSDSSVTYPVTITVTGYQRGLRSGGSANVRIVTASASDVVAVPTSAVRSLGTLKTVSMWRDGQPQTTRVSVGAVGSSLTQITSGLQEGDQVVLADLEEALPTGNTTGFRVPGGIGGGFGGGFAGGRPPGL